MENTSKALLIAAAVLIVILLITLGIRIFSSTSNSQKVATDTGKSISEETGLAISAITGESTSSQTETQYGPIQEIKESNNGYTPKEGDKVTYNNIDYTVLYVEGDTVQMVTNQAMGNFTLGYGDSQARGSNNFEKAVNSYNNAITRLNSYCESLIPKDGNIIDVRSVGSNPKNKNSENATLYTNTRLASWSCKYNGYPVTVDEVGKSGDDNYTQDTEQMRKLGIINCGSYYFLASRVVYVTPSNVDFYVRYVYPDNDYVGGNRLWIACSNGDAFANNCTSAVRPVVTIHSSALSSH